MFAKADHRISPSSTTAPRLGTPALIQGNTNTCAAFPKAQRSLTEAQVTVPTPCRYSNDVFIYIDL
jgi:hypothetical protein